MKPHRWFIPLALFLAASLSVNRLGADGLPYDPENRVMSGTYLALHLSDNQIQQITATGLVAFDPWQLEVLRKFYPEFPTSAAVASSTSNDGMERFDEVHADVIWWYADEMRIMLETPVKGETLYMPETDRPWTQPEGTLFRLSPAAEIFHQGHKISFDQALELVEYAAAKGLPAGDGLAIVLPPPHAFKRQAEPSQLDPEVQKMIPKKPEQNDIDLLVKKIFDRLVAHGETRGLSIFKSW